MSKMKYNFKIQGLDCANCAANLENKIKKIDGIENANISFLTEKLIIECDESKKEEIISKVQKLIKKEEPDCVIKQK